MIWGTIKGKLHWWTGGTDVGRDGKWYWAASLTPVPDFIWKTGEPNNVNYNCMYLAYNDDYDGFDLPCSNPSIYPICQQV